MAMWKTNLLNLFKSILNWKLANSSVPQNSKSAECFTTSTFSVFLLFYGIPVRLQNCVNNFWIVFELVHWVLRSETQNKAQLYPLSFTTSLGMHKPFIVASVSLRRHTLESYWDIIVKRILFLPVHCRESNEEHYQLTTQEHQST